MSNTRQIQPIQIWTSEGEKSINTLALVNFFDYKFDDGAGKIEYKLINVDLEIGATELFTGNLDIPSSVIQQWGASDDIVWEYVIDKLGLTIINQ
jgi:hypothetical protein